jgi:hypothetical protein
MDFSIKNYAAFLITLSQGKPYRKPEASSDVKLPKLSKCNVIIS